MTTMAMRKGALCVGLALSLCLGSLAAFAQAPTAPPPVQVEKPPPSPGPQFVWIAGHWAWQGGRWAWVPGRWVEAQGAWIPGRYQQTRQGWVYVEGRWKK